MIAIGFVSPVGVLNQ